MSAWLLKTEPSSYSLEDLARDKRTRWDGVSNPAALNNIKRMQPGERCFFYHTGDEKRIVGITKVEAVPYADPKSPRLTVVDISFDRKLKKPVTLAQIKADPFFADWPLVRQGRLSVVPTSPEIWKRVMEMASE